MSRSKKAYDWLTFLICANIVGSLAMPIFPYTVFGDVFGANELYTTYGVAVLFGILSALIAAVAVSKFVPNAERGALYSAFTGTFWALWIATTPVIGSIQAVLDKVSGGTSFPINALFWGIGLILWVVALWAFAGADMEG